MAKFAAKISEKDHKGHLVRALKAADWFVNSQFRGERIWMGDIAIPAASSAFCQLPNRRLAAFRNASEL